MSTRNVNAHLWLESNHYGHQVRAPRWSHCYAVDPRSHWHAALKVASRILAIDEEHHPAKFRTTAKLTLAVVNHEEMSLQWDIEEIKPAPKPRKRKAKK